MKELGNPTILARVPVMKPRDKEQLLHNRFAPQRMPQTEYFQLDQEQLEFVLRCCTSWKGEVADLIFEPRIPEGVKPDPHVVRAQPMPCIDPARNQILSPHHARFPRLRKGCIHPGGHRATVIQSVAENAVHHS